MAGHTDRASDAETAADAALERSRTMAAAGQERAALANARQAVRLYRSLAEQEPGVFRPDLALALQTVADLAGVTASAGAAAPGQKDEALRAAREAVSIFRALASSITSDGHDDDPARSASSNADSHEPAEDSASSPAAASHDEDAGKGPAIATDALAPPTDADDETALFRPYLGAALGTLAVRLHATGADDEALATVREGIHLFDNADPDDLRRHRQALDAARLLRNELSPDEHLLDEEFGSMFADSPDA